MSQLQGSATNDDKPTLDTSLDTLKLPPLLSNEAVEVKGAPAPIEPKLSDPHTKHISPEDWTPLDFTTAHRLRPHRITMEKIIVEELGKPGHMDQKTIRLNIIARLAEHRIQVTISQVRDKIKLVRCLSLTSILGAPVANGKKMKNYWAAWRSLHQSPSFEYDVKSGTFCAKVDNAWETQGLSRFHRYFKSSALDFQDEVDRIFSDMENVRTIKVMANLRFGEGSKPTTEPENSPNPKWKSDDEQ